MKPLRIFKSFVAHCVALNVTYPKQEPMKEWQVSTENNLPLMLKLW
jgi:hypothetical protein